MFMGDFKGYPMRMEVADINHDDSYDVVDVDYRVKEELKGLGICSRYSNSYGCLYRKLDEKGEVRAVYGMEGIIPYLDKTLWILWADGEIFQDNLAAQDLAPLSYELVYAGDGHMLGTPFYIKDVEEPPDQTNLIYEIELSIESAVEQVEMEKYGYSSIADEIQPVKIKWDEAEESWICLSVLPWWNTGKEKESVA